MTTGLRFILSYFLCFSGLQGLAAQCQPDETPVSVIIQTDLYGYETFWSLVPGGNACDEAPIASGGNANQVGCDGGGDQDANTFAGYGDNATITVGPFCLKTDSTYSLFHVDDYGDGGTTFTVLLDGFPVHTLQGTGAGNQFDFTVALPAEFDGVLEKITTYAYNDQGPTVIRGILYNGGTSAITAVDLSYSINGGSPVTETLTGLNVAPFTRQPFSLTDPWEPSVAGSYQLTIWLSNINGTADQIPSNDTLSKAVYIRAPLPDLIGSYLTDSVLVVAVGTVDDGLDQPRDLDFAPKETPELWVINKATEQEGGSTVTYFDAGLPTQQPELKKDGNSWHFMSLPTGIAFSYNGNFATSPGVWDANHQGTNNHFTGPTLWSGDWSVYGEPSGGNGSHLDMLHQSPFSMGIEWEEDNVFWVYDGYNENIVRYDFVEDHGPGADNHADGRVLRYTEVEVKRLDDHIPNHLVLDRGSGWLYIVDNGNHRVLRMDSRSGQFAGNLTPYGEPLAQFVKMTGATWSVYIDSLDQPAGIDIVGDHLLISDYASGDILVYDRTGEQGAALGRIQTGEPGIMGIKVGPDGKIWYANSDQNTVNRLDFVPFPVGTPGPAAAGFDLVIAPNPSTGNFEIKLTAAYQGEALGRITVTSELGQKVHEQRIKLNERTPLQLSHLTAGTYFIQVTDGSRVQTERVVIAR
jgi:hypothetical protein